MIRRLDTLTKRRIRSLMVTWRTFCVRCAMTVTHLVCRLPNDRRTTDAALYGAALAAVVLLGALVLFNH